MEKDPATSENFEIAEPVPAFSMSNLDNETIEILIDDKIATGG